MIPYGHQDITPEDIARVLSVLKSEFITQGPEVELFETDVANYCDAKFAISASSATAALHISCLALGLGRGDRLWTSPNTFVASANCGLYCGATVDFVDIDPLTYNISIHALTRKLETAERDGVLPKILVPVHFGGQACDMEQIGFLSNKYGFRVIEDASHAIGGKCKSNIIGGCKFSDITIFSFHPVKIITTGEGGLATTNDEGVARALMRLRSHGITRDVGHMQHEPDGAWEYQQIELGYNYRMTDIHAALGRGQLQRIDDYVSRRQFLAFRYNELLQDLPITLPQCKEPCFSSWHLYPIQVCAEKRSAVFEEMIRNGVGVNVHYKPVHLQPYYRGFGFRDGDFPEAERYYSRAMTLPLFYNLKESQQDYISETLARALDM